MADLIAWLTTPAPPWRTLAWFVAGLFTWAAARSLYRWRKRRKAGEVR